METVESDNSGDNLDCDDGIESGSDTKESNLENPTGGLEVFVDENAGEDQVVGIDLGGSDEEDKSSNVQDCP